jgi:hypothetical protein
VQILSTNKIGAQLLFIDWHMWNFSKKLKNSPKEMRAIIAVNPGVLRY